MARVPTSEILPCGSFAFCLTLFLSRFCCLQRVLLYSGTLKVIREDLELIFPFLLHFCLTPHSAILTLIYEAHNPVDWLTNFLRSSDPQSFSDYFSAHSFELKLFKANLLKVWGKLVFLLHVCVFLHLFVYLLAYGIYLTDVS